MAGVFAGAEPDGLCRGDDAGVREYPCGVGGYPWLDKGVLATNVQLVERAATIVTNMSARVIGPDEVRAKLGLTKRAPRVL